MVDYSPEKAGVGGSTPSLATIDSITYEPSKQQLRSKTFQSRAGVCLNSDSVNRLEALTHDFAAQIHRDFTQEITQDPKALRASVLRLVRRALPLRRGRPNDPRIDAAMRMLEQGKSIREILRLQTRGFEKLDTYGRYLAEKGLRTAIARRRKRTPKTSGRASLAG